jgi:hypothetical protein
LAQARRNGLEIVVLAGLVLGAFFFITNSVGTVTQGIAHVDDAYVALGALSVADGAGYGLPHSSESFIPFDIDLTTGPPMILPLAAAIEILGTRDRLPGAVALAIFGAQAALIGLLAVRAFGLSRTMAFGAAVLLLLVLGSRGPWFYGAFLGEPVALGFIVLAVVSLALVRGQLGAALGGTFGALAVLTKLIAVFPMAGVGLVWIALELRSGSPLSTRWRRIGVFVAAACAPTFAFEAARFLTLGWDGYIANWVMTVSYSGTVGQPATSVADFLRLVFQTVDTRLVRVSIALVVGIGFLLLARFGGSEGRERRPVRTMILLLTGATVFMWVYLGARFDVHDRYLFIAVALPLVTAAVAVLAMGPRARAAAIALVVIAATVLDSKMQLLPKNRQGATFHDELQAIVRTLDASPDVPYVGDFWWSINPVVFARHGAGTWLYGPTVRRFAGQRLFVVLDKVLASDSDELVRDARTACSVVTPNAKRILLYDCGDAFWDSYLLTTTLSRVPPDFIASGATPGGDCNIDFLGQPAPGQFPRVLAGETVPIYGWAADLASAMPPSEVAFVLTDAAGVKTYGALQIHDRPDLGIHFGNPELARTGIRAAIDSTGLPPGSYSLAILISAGERVLECDSRLTLTVDAPSPPAI